MSSFHADLILDGSKFRVLQCDFEITQETSEHHSKPCAKPHGGNINVTIECQTADASITAWALSNIMTKSGSIIFYKQDTKIPLETVSFQTAYCTSYHKTYFAFSETPYQLSFVITAKELSINGQTHKNTW